MGVELALRYPVARRVFEEASDAIGLDLLDLCRVGPEERLRETANTQPALLTCSWAVASTVIHHGVRPDLAAGLSLGEYTALVAAGAMSLHDAVRVVRQRGRLMQEAAEGLETAMAAILGLPSGRVAEVCESVEGFVEVANFNAPGQVVIAGEIAAVEAACDRLRATGARRAMRLAVSAPFHTSLMRSAADRLTPVLESVPLHPALFPVVANVTAQPVQHPAEIRRVLLDQVASPVRWEQSVHTLRALGASAFLEAGPGTTLAGLIRRTLPDVPVLSVENQASLEGALAALATAASAGRTQAAEGMA
ncbi:MAG: ACP S-malonyltransferase [Armatimonadetes bacterium]|nr:ACP S-malonyltransferase [Armatimonadota bacterium]